MPRDCGWWGLKNRCFIPNSDTKFWNSSFWIIFHCLLWGLILMKGGQLYHRLLSHMVFYIVSYGCSYIIVFGGCAIVHIWQFWMHLAMSLHIPFQKKSLLIKEYILFVPACPCKLLPVMLKLGIWVLLELQRIYLNLYYFVYCLILCGEFLTDGMCRVVCMHLQYASCYWRVFYDMAVSAQCIYGKYVCGILDTGYRAHPSGSKSIRQV